MGRTLWILLTCAWALAAIPAAVLVPFSFMLLDDPSAAEHKTTQVLVASFVALPVFFVAGAVVPWFFRSKRVGPWLFAIPLVGMAAVGAALGAMLVAG